MPKPNLLSQSPQIKLDLRGLMKYAKNKGKKVVELTEDEKNAFIQKQKNYDTTLCHKISHGIGSAIYLHYTIA